MATDERLLWLLRKAGEEWGALGVALAAAELTDVRVLIARLSEPVPAVECSDEEIIREVMAEAQEHPGRIVTR